MQQNGPVPVRSPAVASVAVLAALSAGCAGVSPRPVALDIATLATPVLDAAAVGRRDAEVGKAVAAVLQRDYAVAQRAAEAALAIDPRAARARAVRGFVLLQEARREEPPELFALHAGEAEVRTAVALAPDDAFVGYLHAVFLAEIGHLSAAAVAAETALVASKQAPANERAALLGIAGTYRYELGEDRAAYPHLIDYVALRPDDAAGQFRLGNCSLRLASLPQGPTGKAQAQVQLDAAARAFARAFELVPGDLSAGLAVGTTQARGAELARERGEEPLAERLAVAAEQQFARLAEQFPAAAEPPYCLAVVQAARGDLAAAGVSLAAALARDPLHLGALLRVAAAVDPAQPGQLRQALTRVLYADDARGGLSGRERQAIARRLAALDQKPRIE